MILLNAGEKEITVVQNGRYLEFNKRNSPLVFKYDLAEKDFLCYKKRSQEYVHKSPSDINRWFKDSKLTTEDKKIETMFEFAKYVCSDTTRVYDIMREFRRERMVNIEKWAALGISLDHFRNWGTRNYRNEVTLNIEYEPNEIPKSIRDYIVSKTWSLTDLNSFLNGYHNAGSTVCEIFDQIKEHPEYESAFIRVARGVTYNHLHHTNVINGLYDLITRFNLKVPRLMIYLHYLNEVERIDVLELLCSYESYLTAELEKCNGKKNKMFKYPNHYKSVFHVQQEVLRREQELANYDLSGDAVANQHLEYSDDDFMIIVPKSPEDVQEEGRQQKHCIAQSYLSHIACGDTVCVFMRRTSEPSKSLITIEIRNGTIRQACIGKNHTVPREYRDWIKNWAEIKGVTVNNDSWNTTLVY